MSNNNKPDMKQLDNIQKICPTLTAASMMVNQEDFDLVADIFEICVGRRCGQFKLCQGNMSVVQG